MNQNNFKILEGICCVCGHQLNDHLDESNGWRCHSLGQDYYQCECWLRKDRTNNEGIDYYDHIKRKFQFLKESNIDLTTKENQELFLNKREIDYFNKLKEI